MVHELGHLVDLRRRTVVVQRERHQVVVVCGGREVHALCSVIAVVGAGAGIVGCIAVAAIAVGRILPITDDLGHGSGHASDVNMAARTVVVNGAKCIVGRVLVPCGLQQRSYAVQGGHHLHIPGEPLIPLCHVCLAILIGEVLHGGDNLLGVVVKKPAYVFRHVVNDKAGFGRVAKDGPHPRVGGNHHELAAEVKHVENIHGRGL